MARSVVSTELSNQEKRGLQPPENAGTPENIREPTEIDLGNASPPCASPLSKIEH